MRAVTSHDHAVHLIDAPEPAGEGVMVTVTSAGICGSDIHMVHAGASGTILGHEFGGRLADGSLVAVRPTGECGSCSHCRAQRPQVCPDAIGRLHGSSIDGGWAERVMVDPRNIVPMPKGVNERDVALVEPLAVAVHGVERSQVAPGERAVIIGAGSIGLVTAVVLRHRGIDVDVIARHRHQIDAASSLGAGINTGRDYDVVFDAVCTQESMNQAIALSRPGGRILEFGLFWTPVSLNNMMLLKEISIIPSIFYSHDHGRDDFTEAADVLARSPEVADILVTHRFGLADAVNAFAAASDRASGSIKVQMHP